MQIIDRSHCPKLSWLAGTAALFALAGCGGPKLYSVKGTITCPDGTPMSYEGQVIFNAVEPKGQGNPRGMIKPDGTFRMGTLAEADGAPEGDYRVAIVPMPPENPKKPPPGYPPFDAKYMSYSTSGLEFTVTRGKNELNIVVEK